MNIHGTMTQSITHKTLYAYFDIDRLNVAWEVAVGRIKSAPPNTPTNFGVSIWSYNICKKLANDKCNKSIFDEFALERERLIHYPNKVSRLQGVYFFKNKEDAIEAIHRWNIPKKNLNYISSVRFAATNMTEVDSEWITDCLGTGTQEQWMDKYWAGETRWENPLTEILALGVGHVENTQLREQAYKNILKIAPYSSPLLYAACCAFHCGMTDVALTIPALTSDKSYIHGNYYIQADKLDEKALISSINYCRQQGYSMPIKKHPDDSIIFTLPDLRNESFKIHSSKLLSTFTEIKTLHSL